MTVKEFYEYMERIGAEDYKLMSDDCNELEVEYIQVKLPQYQLDGVGRVYI